MLVQGHEGEYFANFDINSHLQKYVHVHVHVYVGFHVCICVKTKRCVGVNPTTLM